MQIFGQNISALIKYHYKYVKFSILTYIVTKKVVELTGDVLTLQINLYQL